MSDRPSPESTPRPEATTRPLPLARPGGLGVDSIPALLAVELSLNAVMLSGMNKHLTYVNPALLTMWGATSREELLGRAATTLWADVEQSERAGHAAFEAGTWRGELQGRRVDGQLFWAELMLTLIRDDRGDPSGMMGTAIDITDRKRIEGELRQEQYFLERSQEVARLGSYDLNIVTGQWTCTKTLEDIFGIDASFPHTIEGWIDLILPEQRGSMVHHLQVHAIEQRNRFEHPYQIRRQHDGMVRWVFGMGELEFDESGRAVRMIGTIQDITERRRMEDARIELERRLLQAQKLESLGVLTGGIAHDFNNLLMAMLGNLDLAIGHLPPDSPARRCVESSLEAAHRAADLTRQMLAYSGRAACDSQDLDLNAVVNEHAPLLRAGLSKKLTLQMQLSPQIRSIRADAGQMEQLLVNLVTNAAEAIGDNPGTITLTTGVEDVDAARLARNRLDQSPGAGPFVVLRIADTGCGMDEATLERLFDPFFTTKFMGRGLGMSAVHGIVRGHDGAILVRSTPGGGTEIEVLLPAGAWVGAAATPATDRREPRPEPDTHEPDRITRRIRRTGDTDDTSRLEPSARHRRHVLVVDDEELVRDVCARILRHSGWQVYEATGGRHAIEIFEAHQDEIACVVLDLSMPEMDGIRVCAALRAIRDDVPVILSSGYSQSDTSLDPQHEGFAGFIQKPYSARSLRDEVLRIVKGTAGATSAG